jgi:exodeoxyribonuclease VII small subunit
MENMTYAQAVARLEEIMNAVQGGKVDVDELAGLLKEATGLLHFCNEKLYKVDEEVKSLIDGMNGGVA